MCSTHDPVIVGPGRWPEGIHWLPARYVLGQLRRVALGDVDTVGGWKPHLLAGPLERPSVINLRPRVPNAPRPGSAATWTGNWTVAQPGRGGSRTPLRSPSGTSVGEGTKVPTSTSCRGSSVVDSGALPVFPRDSPTPDEARASLGVCVSASLGLTAYVRWSLRA